MMRLKTILQYRYTTLIIFLIIIVISGIRLLIPDSSLIDKTSTELIGTLLEYKIDGDKLSFIIKDKEKVKCTYYIKTLEEKNNLSNLKLGITLSINGSLSTPSNNTIPNTFNYKNYLNNNDIYYIMNVDKLSVINNTTNIFYKIKNTLNKYINTFKSKGYLQTFTTGNKNYLNEGTYSKYQELGVSHIFAISGMHVSILASIIFKLLFKLKEKYKYYIVIAFLLLYIFITNYTASILRSISLYICLFLNKRLDTNLSTIQVFYIAISILLLINPKLLFNIGFLYSSVVSFSLINYNYLIKGNYIMKCLKISIIAFLFSLPITINNNFEINILSIFNNLIFVPLITFIVYPLSLITLVIPYLDNIYFNLMNYVEYLSNYLLIFNIIIPKLNIIAIILYYIFLHIFLISYDKKYLLLLIGIILITKYTYLIDNNYYVYFLDVGQGDSTLIKYKSDAILIDTGGKITYEKEEWAKSKEYPLSDNTITFLKSIGVSNLSSLILTHGDRDHMGEAMNIVNNFKVDKVIFNNGEINYLETELIKLLKIKEIPYYQNIIELDNLYFINNNLYNNENDNSSVIYTRLYDTSLLFMGDAGIEVEEDILKSFNFNNIDILKVGHHGSATSSSANFINTIKPKYSIISVGKNNRYGHPNPNVLKNLSISTIYRTDQNGTIIFKINKNEINKEIIS